MLGLVCVLGLAIAAAGCGGGSSDSGGGDTTAPADTSAPADTGGGAAGGEQLTLTIGFSAALSGAYAAYDVPLLNGMEFAAEQINAAGGPVTVEIVSKDNKGDQTQTLTTAQELLDEGITVQVMTTADAGLASGQLVSQAGGIMSVGGNTAPAIVRDGGERVFAFVFGDNQQASAGAQYACDQGYKTAYVLGSPEIPYTKDMPTFFADAFAQICGGEIVGEDTFKIGQTEFGPQVTKIQNASPAPDVLFSPIFVPDSGALLKQLRSAGVETPLVTTDGNDTTLFVDSGGSAVDGTVYSTHGFDEPGTPMAEFIDQYTEWKGSAPESNTFEAIGRDNVYAYVQAAENAGSTEPDALLAAVLALKDVPLLTGTMTMDPETRLPTKPITLVQMQGTEFTLLEQIIPSYIAPAQ
jgi:branched-chain amino acid transport system substrate-binding protein